MSLSARDPRHGTYTGYRNHGCKCAACMAANVTYQRERGSGGYSTDECACGSIKFVASKKCRACDRAERAAEHGTESRYCGGCRCDKCRMAARDAQRQRRARRAGRKVAA